MEGSISPHGLGAKEEWLRKPAVIVSKHFSQEGPGRLALPFGPQKATL